MVRLIWIDRVGAEDTEPDPKPTHVMPCLSDDDDDSFSSILVLGLSPHREYRIFVDFDLGRYDGSAFARLRTNNIGALSISMEVAEIVC